MSGLNKTPHITHSENLPPWQWKVERAPVNLNPGPALHVSVNSVDVTPAGEALVIQTECVQNAPAGMSPLAANIPVSPYEEANVLEDGKETALSEGKCLQNANPVSIPHSRSLDVIREEASLVLENVKMSKGLV